MAAPQQLPCSPYWVTPDVIACLAPDDADITDPCDPGPAVPATYPFTDEDYNRMASSLLFQRTCRRFPGECPVALRPCDPCRACGDCCKCHYEFIPLAGPYPVISVEEVKINGVVVDPSLYRVDEYVRLVRTDGLSWPRWQDMNQDPDIVGTQTLIIRYTTGRPVPLELQLAAAMLMRELKKACTPGSSCQLPERITSVVRDGVSYEVLDAQEVAAEGSFGIPMVDTILKGYSCDDNKGMPQMTSRLMHPLLDGERYDRSGVRVV